MEDKALTLAKRVLNEQQTEGMLPYEEALRVLAQGVVDREDMANEAQ
jgi:hypothetical protein